MNRYLGAGIVLTAIGLVGYAVGIAIAYPGRALSLTAVMLGITISLVARGGEGAAT